MKYCKLLPVALFFCFSISSFAQKMTDKPYTAWSKDEALRILSDSNWAKTYQSTKDSALSAAGQVSREQSQSVYGGGSNPRSVERNFGPPPIVLRLHSGLPVRQAIIRMQQIEMGYDKMSVEQKSKFDEAAKKFLDCPICKDYYVVTITKYPQGNRGGVDEAIFERTKLEDIKGMVWLMNDKGEKRDLIQFTPPSRAGEPAVFFFPRLDENKNPLLTKDSKEIKFIFHNDFLDSKNPYAYLVPRTFEFKASKLVTGDKVEF